MNKALKIRKRKIATFIKILFVLMKKILVKTKENPIDGQKECFKRRTKVEM
jgi:hypothetical protein